MNAIVGDNGIISNAQNANVKNGMTALEEWLQEKYVEYYDESEKYYYFDDTGKKHYSKQELLASKINDLFLKDGTRNYIVNGGNVYYLVNKSSLPEEIQSVLKSGNSTEYVNYTRLIDVYGITDDLKVYYYDSESGKIYGTLESSNINLKNIVAAGINSDPELKVIITDTLNSLGVEIDESKGITIGNSVAIKDLQIDGTKNSLSSVSGLAELKNLQTLTLSNLTLSNLDGLQGCPKLYYLYLKNCKITDYSKLSSILELQYLYLYLPNTMDETTANTQVTNLGMGLSNTSGLNKLTYLGISGNTYMFNDSIIKDFHNPKVSSNNNNKLTWNNSVHSNLSSLNGLSLLHSQIKKKIQYLYLNNNAFSNVNALSDYSNLIELNLMSNPYLIDIDGIQNNKLIEQLTLQYCNLSSLNSLKNLNKIKWLSIQNNINLTSLEGLKLNNLNSNYLIANSCNISDISSLENSNKMYYLDLEKNNLNDVTYLSNLNEIRYLYLKENENMTNNSVMQIENIITNCGVNYSIPDKYISLFSSLPSLDYNNKSLNDFSDEIVKLKNKTNIYFLRLSNNPDLGQSRIVDLLSCDVISITEIDNIIQNLSLTEIEINYLKSLKNRSIDNIKGLSVTEKESMEELNDIYFRYILSTLSGLKQLSVADTKISSLDFIKNIGNKNVITELDIRNTLIDDCSILDTYCNNLNTLAISNPDIDLSKFQKTISSLGRGYGYDKSVLTGGSLISNNTGLILCSDGFDFSNCNEVTKLSCSYQSIDLNSHYHTFDLSNMSKLKSVNFVSNFCSWKLPSSVIECKDIQSQNCDYTLCSNLKTLNASWKSNSSFNLENALATAINAPIEFLDIGCCTSADLSKLKVLVTAKNTLKSIVRIGSNGNNYRAKGKIDALKDFSNLKEIDINYGCSEEFFNYTEEMKNMNNMLYLTAVGNNLTNLKGLKYLPNLYYINISNNKIVDISEFQYLENLGKKYTTSYINSGNTTVQNTLDLSNNYIVDLTPLVTAIGSDNLINYTTLNVSNNSLDGTSVADNVLNLLKLHEAGLTTVTITGNAFTENEIQELINGKTVDGVTYTGFGASNVKN